MGQPLRMHCFFHHASQRSTVEPAKRLRSPLLSDLRNQRAAFHQVSLLPATPRQFQLFQCSRNLREIRFLRFLEKHFTQALYEPSWCFFLESLLPPGE